MAIDHKKIIDFYMSFSDWMDANCLDLDNQSKYICLRLLSLGCAKLSALPAAVLSAEELQEVEEILAAFDVGTDKVAEESAAILECVACLGGCQ